MGKGDSFGFLKKITIMHNMGEISHFWIQNQHLWVIL